jgi:hypothetical protein
VFVPPATRKGQEDADRAIKEISEEEKAAGAPATVSQNEEQANKGKARTGRVDDEQDDSRKGGAIKGHK